MQITNNSGVPQLITGAGISDVIGTADCGREWFAAHHYNENYPEIENETTAPNPPHPLPSVVIELEPGEYVDSPILRTYMIRAAGNYCQGVPISMTGFVTASPLRAPSYPVTVTTTGSDGGVVEGMATLTAADGTTYPGTLAAGQVVVEGVPDGTYTVTVASTNGYTQTAPVSVTVAGSAATINVAMTAPAPATYPVTVTTTGSDEGIVEGTATLTAADGTTYPGTLVAGQVVVPGLPDGTYTVTVASTNGYTQTAPVSVTVAGSAATINVAMTAPAPAPSPTAPAPSPTPSAPAPSPTVVPPTVVPPTAVPTAPAQPTATVAATATVSPTNVAVTKLPSTGSGEGAGVELAAAVSLLMIGVGLATRRRFSRQA